jgi:hypothetical protein
MAKRNQSNFKGMTIADLLDKDSVDLKEIFIKYIYESHVLADEPEFLDLYFDEHAVMRSAKEVHKKYEKRLLAAEEVGGEELELTRDEMLMAAVDRLLTPRIRKDILNRLDVLVNRFLDTADTEGYLMASAVLKALKPGDFSWGASSLVSALYKRSLDKALGPELDWELPEEILTLFGDDLTPDEVLSRVSGPEFTKALGEILESDPDLYQTLADRTDKVLDKFIKEVWLGEIEIDLFTVAEIKSFSALLDKRLEEGDIDFSKDDFSGAAGILFSTFREYIDEIVTLRRLGQITKRLKKVSKDWMEDGLSHGFVLNILVDELKDDKPSENRLVISVLASQYFQMYKDEEAEQVRQPTYGGRKSTPRRKTKRGRRGKKKIWK